MLKEPWYIIYNLESQMTCNLKVLFLKEKVCKNILLPYEFSKFEIQ